MTPVSSSPTKEAPFTPHERESSKSETVYVTEFDDLIMKVERSIVDGDRPTYWIEIAAIAEEAMVHVAQFADYDLPSMLALLMDAQEFIREDAKMKAWFPTS